MNILSIRVVLFVVVVYLCDIILKFTGDSEEQVWVCFWNK